MLEALGDIGIGDEKTLATIEPFAQHPRPLIRAAACRALLQLTGDPQWGNQLLKLLQHPEPLVRGALLDLGATGWTAALPTISAVARAQSQTGRPQRTCGKSEDPDVLDVMDALL